MSDSGKDQIRARFRKGWDGFSLEVDLCLPGRGITALFGHSGSGKTTLLRCLAGLGARPEGECAFKGTLWQQGRYWLPAHKRPIGYVFQDANLFPHLSVLQNLQYGQKRVGGPGTVALEQAIALLGIEPLLARKREILPYLERLHNELAIPVIYVTHSPDEVARLADHLVVMAKGRVLASGPLTETLSRLDLPIRLGEEAGVVLEGQISQRDEAWHLIRLAFPGGQLWARDTGRPLGQKARIRVLARDVSLCLLPHHDSSIQNHLPGVVEAMLADEHPGLTLVRVRVGEGEHSSAFIARLTARSAHVLQLTVGQAIWLQVKSVALVE